MKTHDIALILEEIAQIINKESYSKIDIPILKNTLNELQNLLKKNSNIECDDARIVRKNDDVASNLKSLISLSNYSKQEWLSIIDEFQLKIELNSRASTRDIVGKVLSYIEKNPESLKRAKKSTQNKKTENTEILADTLEKLINFK